MTDELTPEERDALKNLPRERMPSAGLEDRVVGAMRSRGVLAVKRPGRVVRITTSRVAGLLAASIVLIVGAYSIGLHRGGENEVIRSSVWQDAARPGVRPPELGELEIETEPAEPVITESVQMQSAPTSAEEKAAAPPDAKLKREIETSASRSDVTPEPAPGAARNEASDMQEALSARDEAGEGAGETGRALKKQITVQPPATMAFDARGSLASGERQRTYTLGGSAFIVDAPDSVRIVEDPDGRMLLIYTSDGLIRIRLAD